MYKNDLLGDKLNDKNYFIALGPYCLSIFSKRTSIRPFITGWPFFVFWDNFLKFSLFFSVYLLRASSLSFLLASFIYEQKNWMNI